MNYAVPICIIPDRTIHPVTDDLVGLARVLANGLDDIAALARVHGSLPGQLEMQGRAHAHLSETRRLVRYLARASDSLESWGQVILALTYLHYAAHLATLLLPVRSTDDRWVRAELGNTLIERAEQSGDVEKMVIVRRATAGGCGDGPAVIEAGDNQGLGKALAVMARRAGTAPRRAATEPLAGTPSFHPLEHRASLEVFIGAVPDLSDLALRGRELLLQSDGYRPSRNPAALRDAAVEMARILGYAQLIRAVLWPTPREEDRESKAAIRDLVRSRTHDPERLGAIVEIALDGGQMLSRVRAQFEAMRQRA